jgi:hypothetical protein
MVLSVMAKHRSTIDNVQSSLFPLSIAKAMHWQPLTLSHIC